jgi:hypothetical protein
MFLIIALDGGGVRGALQMTLLGRLFARFPWLESYVKMYAGSSAGGILGAALATRPFAEAQRLATPDAYAKIFTQSWLQDIRSVDGWYAAQFSNAPLKKLLESAFGDARVCDASKYLLVTAFCIAPQLASPDYANCTSPSNAGWKPRLYHNLAGACSESSKSVENAPKTNNANVCRSCASENPDAQITKSAKNDGSGAGDDGHSTDRLVDVTLETSAAPTYFPAHRGCSDGGILANNPSMLATLEAANYGLARLDNIIVLSIGTGVYPLKIGGSGTSESKKSSGDLGMIQWGPELVSLLMQANSEATTLEACLLLGKQRYMRLQPILPKPIDLADYKSVPELIRVGMEYDLEPAITFIQQFVEPYYLAEHGPFVG